ncbi:thioesterase domain-containing protein, partial [Nostoc sp. NIES-2111]
LEGNRESYEHSTLLEILKVWRDTFETIVAQQAATLDHQGTALLSKATAKGSAESRIVTTRKAKAWSDDARILHLSTEGTETPFIVINIGGFMRRLAQCMPERRFIDIAFWGPLDPPKVGATLDDYVDEAISLIRAAVPKGPYIIGGECFSGSTVAVEVVRRLQQVGERIEFFVVFDGWAAGYRERLPRQLQRWRRFRIKVARWRREGGIINNLIRYLQSSHSAIIGPEPTADELKTQSYRHNLMLLCEKHRPKPLDIPMLLFRTDEALSGFGFRYDMGWRDVAAGELTIKKVQGSHHQIYDDTAAPIVAHKIRETAQRLANKKIMETNNSKVETT